MPSRIQQMTSALKWNLYTFFKNIRIRRDNSVVLVGAWMGLKFADNSRFLFQYLSENMNSLKLRKVIWITRNSEVKETLENMGYESYLVGTEESNYWHLKAGIHIVCNAVNDIPNFHSDIDTKLSFGAHKVQLWHGVGGIKAVGAASNKAKSTVKRHAILKGITHARLFSALLSEGGWAEAHVLATGKDCAEPLQAYIACRKDRIFVSGYPRNCECIKLLEVEEKFIKELEDYNGSVLYLPTFRSDNSNFVHPLQDDRIRSFIRENNILWIEKPHTADISKDALAAEGANIRNLDSSFDINTIYRRVSCVITDYSSVAFDAVYHKKPLIIYAPDIEKFRHGDVGFIIDFEGLFEKELCETTEGALKLLQEVYSEDGAYVEKREQSYFSINQYAFENRKYDYSEIWEDIEKLI